MNPKAPQQPMHPFGHGQTPYNPQQGGYLPLEDSREIRQFKIVEEYDDCLSCQDEYEQLVYVAKPFMHRRSLFDGRLISDVQYTYIDSSSRAVGDAVELLVPRYMPNEWIRAARYREGIWSPDFERDLEMYPLPNPENGPVEWEDINTAGRTWMPSMSMFPVMMTEDGAGSSGGDSSQCSFTYTVTAFDGTELATSVNPTTGNHKAQRPSLGTLIAATAGIAYRNTDGDLCIVYTNEVLDTEACS